MDERIKLVSEIRYFLIKIKLSYPILISIFRYTLLTMHKSVKYKAIDCPIGVDKHLAWAVWDYHAKFPIDSCRCPLKAIADCSFWQR